MPSSLDTIKWLEKAAGQGHRDAQYQLGLRYEQGKEVRNVAMWRCVGLRRLRPSSNRIALLILARKAAPEEVFSFYQRAANAGSAPAQLWLGPAYLAGEKVAQDLALGRYWLALAAGNGSHEAEYQLSLQQSDAAAQAYWLMRAAEGGFSQVQFALAEWLQERGDLAAARQCFSQAAAQGNVDAHYAYGEMLRLGGKEDYAQALKHYRLAANAHHRSAQYRMGIMREQGLGVPRNRLHAYAWCLLAATDGNNDTTKARDELEKGMAEKEESAGQKLAQHWFVTLAQGKRLENY